MRLHDFGFGSVWREDPTGSQPTQDQPRLSFFMIPTFRTSVVREAPPY